MHFQDPKTHQLNKKLLGAKAFREKVSWAVCRAMGLWGYGAMGLLDYRTGFKRTVGLWGFGAGGAVRLVCTGALKLQVVPQQLRSSCTMAAPSFHHHPVSSFQFPSPHFFHFHCHLFHSSSVPLWFPPPKISLQGLSPCSVVLAPATHV